MLLVERIINTDACAFNHHLMLGCKAFTDSVSPLL
jgi:hypothetical protein